MVRVAESESDFAITTDNPYLALSGKLWSVFCEDCGENWPRYNSTELYCISTLKLFLIFWHFQSYNLFTLYFDNTFPFPHKSCSSLLTHWGRVTHICVSKITIIGSDNDLLPGRRQAILWTSAGILLMGPFGTNFSEILVAIHIVWFKKMHLKMSSGKLRPSCLGLSVLTHWSLIYIYCVYIFLSMAGLTLNMWGPSYLGLTRSISWLLMPWLLTSPGHQQPWYWLCRIGRFLSYLSKDFNYLRHINVEKWHIMWIYVYVLSEKFACKGLTHKPRDDD